MSHPEGSIIGFFHSLQGTDKCGDQAEMEKAEASPMYDYKRAYFKIVQGLINEFRFGHITDPDLAKDIFGPEFWDTIIYHRLGYEIIPVG